MSQIMPGGHSLKYEQVQLLLFQLPPFIQQ
jgi:hypothetical protein